MTRPLRIAKPGGWYHVFNRGAGRHDIFLDDEDRADFLRVLGRASDRASVEVHGYALMTNHYHLLIRTPEPTISKMMHYLDSIYARRFNRRHFRDGPVFRGRFGSPLVADDAYLVEVARYIERNPIESGLVRRAADYAWSSMGAHLGRSKRPHWLQSGPLETYFGGDRTAFERFVAQDVISADLPDAVELATAPAAVGNRVALTELLARTTPGAETHASWRRSAPASDTGAIERAVARAFVVPLASLRQGGRGRPNPARLLVAFLAYEDAHLTHAVIAERFGFGSEKAVSKAVGRARSLVAGDPEFSRALDAVRASVGPGSRFEEAA